MTTGKTIALTRRTFVGKIMSLFFNTGLDLIDRVPEVLWTEVHDIVQETEQDHPQEKEMQKSKTAV